MPEKKDQLPIMPEGTDPATLLKAWGAGKKYQEIANLLRISEDTYKKWVGGTANIPHQRLPDIVRVFRLNEEQTTQLYEAMQRIAPRKNNLSPQNRFFTGREAYIERLDQYFKEDDCVVISGIGGIGKTQLALEYVHRRYKEKTYRAVLWMNAADQTTIENSYRALAEELDLLERDEREIGRTIRAVKRWFAEHTNWLLVMDNADDLYLARTFFPAQDSGHILLTTRTQIVGTVTDRQIELEMMEPAEGQRFLLLRSRTAKDETALEAVAPDVLQAASQLVELLGGHPLALDQAGAYIEETGISLAAYIQLYDNERQDLLNRRTPLNNTSVEHPVAVATTFDLCFQQASAAHPLATDILRFCAFLQPDAIPEELFQYYKGFTFGTTTFHEGIAALLQYSLIKHNKQKKVFSLHRLVQAAIIDGLPIESKEVWQKRVLRAVNTVFPIPTIEEITTEMNQCSQLLPHALACASWIGPDIALTHEASELLHRAGVYLRRCSRFEEAEALLIRVIAFQEQYEGDEHLDTASGLYDLAFLYHRQSKFDQAEALYQRVITIREERLGTDHYLTVFSRDILARLQRERDVDVKYLNASYYVMLEYTYGEAPLDSSELGREYAEVLHLIMERRTRAAALKSSDSRQPKG